MGAGQAACLLTHPPRRKDDREVMLRRDEAGTSGGPGLEYGDCQIRELFEVRICHLLTSLVFET